MGFRHDYEHRLPDGGLHRKKTGAARHARQLSCDPEINGGARSFPAQILDRQECLSYDKNFMAPASPAIEIENLRKVYGSKSAVDGLSLTVPRGSFFGF